MVAIPKRQCDRAKKGQAFSYWWLVDGDGKMIRIWLASVEVLALTACQSLLTVALTFTITSMLTNLVNCLK